MGELFFIFLSGTVFYFKCFLRIFTVGNITSNANQTMKFSSKPVIKRNLEHFIIVNDVILGTCAFFRLADSTCSHSIPIALHA